MGTAVRRAPAVAAGASAVTPLGIVGIAGTVTSVSYVPSADITGHATNNRTLSLINKGADGNGTTVIASLTLTVANSMTDFNETALTLSAVDGATTVAADDVLAWSSVFAASGVADPGGLVHVEVVPTNTGHSTSGYVRGFPAVEA